MIFELFMHHIDFYSIFFVLTCSLPLVFFFFLVLFLCLYPFPSTMPTKTRANRTPSISFVSPSRSQLFKNDHCREVFKKLNCKRKIWAERSVVLDEVDPAIRQTLRVEVSCSC